MSSELLTPNPLSTQRLCLPKAGDTHSPGGEGVGGSILRKTPDIGLAFYSIIPLRLHPSPPPTSAPTLKWTNRPHTGLIRTHEACPEPNYDPGQHQPTTYNFCTYCIYTDTKKNRPTDINNSSSAWAEHISRSHAIFKNSVSCNRQLPAFFPPT